MERENQILKRRVEIADTFVVQSTWQSATPVDVDVYIESTLYTDKDELLLFDPRAKFPPTFRGHLRSDDDTTVGPDIWVINSARSNISYNVFAYLHSTPPNLGEVSVTTQFANVSFKRYMDSVTLSGAKTFELVGVLRTDEKGWTSVQPVTDADRAREQQAVNARMRATTQPKEYGS